MQNITLIGTDLGKHSFHIHCQDKSGKDLLRKKFTRTKLMQFLATYPPSVVVMEACAGAHFLARRISDFGHETKLISPQFARLSKVIRMILLMQKPYVKRLHDHQYVLSSQELRPSRQ